MSEPTRPGDPSAEAPASPEQRGTPDTPDTAPEAVPGVNEGAEILSSAETAWSEGENTEPPPSAEGAPEGVSALSGLSGEAKKKPRKRAENAPGLRVVPSPAPAPDLAPIIEAILFAAEAPVSRPALRELLPERGNAEIDAALQQLQTRYGPPWGVHLIEVASGFQLRTAPTHREYVASALKVKPQRLSKAALETLAVVAYRQPLTRPEIDEMRGVDSGGAMKTLLERRFLRILGRKEEPGRPVLYGTSREFLEFFGLRDLNALPSLAELKALQEEENAITTGTPEESGVLSYEGRSMGTVPKEVIDDVERALAEVERASKVLPLGGETAEKAAEKAADRPRESKPGEK